MSAKECSQLTCHGISVTQTVAELPEFSEDHHNQSVRLTAAPPLSDGHVTPTTNVPTMNPAGHTSAVAAEART
jgi:hypothetical protein